jgi:hypothetical protein
LLFAITATSASRSESSLASVFTAVRHDMIGAALVRARRRCASSEPYRISHHAAAKSNAETDGTSQRAGPPFAVSDRTPSNFSVIS